MLFYDYLHEKLPSLTEEWYHGLDKTKGGVYGTCNPSEIETLKKQNYDFHSIFITLFDEDEDSCSDEAFQRWIDSITSDEAHLNTALPDIIEEFHRNQQLYLQHVEKYFYHHGDQLAFEDYASCVQKITDTFKDIVVAFSIKNQAKSKQLIHAQSELITELSSPIIDLNEKISLLPLVGEIDTHRAKIIFTNTIESCAKRQIQCLLVDLSGVPIIDTMVANELFQLIKGLTLVGTRTSLSGVRPEIAQTAVQIGIDFSGLKIYSSIAHALAKLDFSTIDM